MMPRARLIIAVDVRRRRRGRRGTSLRTGSTSVGLRCRAASRFLPLSMLPSLGFGRRLADRRSSSCATSASVTMSARQSLITATLVVCSYSSRRGVELVHRRVDAFVDPRHDRAARRGPIAGSISLRCSAREPAEHVVASAARGGGGGSMPTRSRGYCARAQRPLDVLQAVVPAVDSRRRGCGACRTAGRGRRARPSCPPASSW